MNISLQEIVFYIVGACIIACSILAVTTGKILRAATYLLFVLFRYGSHLRNPGLYLPERCTGDGLRRRYRGAVCILHPADPVGQEYEVQNKPRQSSSVYC